MPGDPFADYLSAMRSHLAAGDATEHTHRPALAAFIEALAPGVQAINEPKQRTDCGAPDMRVRRRELTLGYIECKDVGVSLDDEQSSEQVERYLKHLSNFVLTDYLEFRWYVDGHLRLRANPAYRSPDGKIIRDTPGVQAAEKLLRSFLSHTPEPIGKPKDLAQRMARLTHVIRDIIVEAFKQGRASNTLTGLHQAFQKTLIPDLAVEQFADMFAQTLAYGLFAARVNHKGPQAFTRPDASREIPKTNPFLRQLFDAITGVALDDEPFVGFVDDLVELLANADMGAILRDFGKRTRKEDPIVHFYETFLIAYNPKERKLRGVYYTPEPVISYIVRSVDHILKTTFGLAGGLADNATVEYEREEQRGDKREKATATAPRVLILDPACGTGGFLYAVVDHIRDEFMRRGDAGMWSGYVREHLLPRLFGFELLMAPYAVAHLKLGMQLAAQDMPEAQREQWAYDFEHGGDFERGGADFQSARAGYNPFGRLRAGSAPPRLGIYLTNTLEEAERRAETLFGPLRIITEEANAAAEIKRDLPIMVVLGNPPYAGHSANRSWKIEEVKGKQKRVPTFIGKLLRDYYQVDGQPLGERNPKMLQDDYVKFIRFGQWRIEQTGAGVLAFITNHGYLDNPTFRGMRQQLMRTFTDIYVLDLHGNARRNERCPDGSKDENVFDIQQGVAIGIFVRDPGRAGPPRVHHAHLWGLRGPGKAEPGKYEWLASNEMETTRWADVCAGPPCHYLVPVSTSLGEEYNRGWSVSRSLVFGRGGPTSSRDHFAIALEAETLRSRLAHLADERISDEEIRARYQLTDTSTWSLAAARKEVREEAQSDALIVRCLYRPWDLRYMLYGHVAFDRPRTDLNDHLLRPNIALITSRQTREAFSALACNLPCGQHKLATVYDRSYVFPLYLYAAAGPRAGGQRELEESGQAHLLATDPVDGGADFQSANQVAGCNPFGRLRAGSAPPGVGGGRRVADTVDDRLRISTRRLPHWQMGGATYFLTFRLKRADWKSAPPAPADGEPAPARGKSAPPALADGEPAPARGESAPTASADWKSAPPRGEPAPAVAPLSAEERQVAKQAILFWHGNKWTVHALTVMPDHAHILATPLEQSSGLWFSLSKIVQSVKRRAARELNRSRGTRGSVWQAEGFDRIVRDEAEFAEKAKYILNNAVRAGLTDDGWSYDGFWCEEQGGQGGGLQGGTAKGGRLQICPTGGTSGCSPTRRANLAPGFLADLKAHLGLESIPDGRGDLRRTFGPEDVFHYIYAILHSPTYRRRYAELLKTDFPRIPLTSSIEVFRALVAKGADLVALHIMEDDYPAASWQVGNPPHQSPFSRLITCFPVPGENLVDKGYPRYFAPGHRLADEPEPLTAGRVYIGSADTKKGTRGQYFDGVPPEVWNFHVGGYQVCEKWLKDRRGREMSYDDLTHYQRVVVALKETIRLMAEIDEAIPGWPLE